MIATYITYGLLILIWIHVVTITAWTMREPTLSPDEEDMELGHVPSYVNPDLAAERLRNPPESLPDF
jgi:hypothetical protein